MKNQEVSELQKWKNIHYDESMEIEKLKEERERILERSKLFFRLATDGIRILESLSKQVKLTPFILNWIKAAKASTTRRRRNR